MVCLLALGLPAAHGLAAQAPVIRRALTPLHAPARASYAPGAAMMLPSVQRSGLSAMGKVGGRKVSMLLPTQTVVALGLNSGLAAFGKLQGQKVLTPAGLVHAWALGVILWACLGWRGWSTGVLYLVGGSVVTKIKKAKKEAMGIAEGRGGMRGPENVWGSAATSAVCALATMQWPARATLLRVGFLAAFATKLSDTCASEIGKAYGTKTYMITTLRECKPGDEGGVSLEGTAAGVVGSIALTLWGGLCGLVSSAAILPCLLAAFIATNIESVIGATAQDKYNWLTNEVVNFIMTVIGAAAAMGIAMVL